MSAAHALFLGVLQGVTEFLPVSSSGHLVLGEYFLGLRLPQEVLQHFDIVLHGGTLLALLVYFFPTWRKLLHSLLSADQPGEVALLPWLVLATVPAVIGGFVLGPWIESQGHDLLPVVWQLVATGVILLLPNLLRYSLVGAKKLTWLHAVTMGVGQAIAILPGISRSGMTIVSGVLTGLPLARSAEVSFLMAAPVLAGAVVYTVMRGGISLSVLHWSALLVGFLTSFGSSLLVLHWFLKFTQRYGIWMWSVYLFALTGLVLAIEML